MEAVGEFTVGVDGRAVRRSRATVLRLAAVSAGVCLGLAVVLTALSLVSVRLAGPVALVQLPCAALSAVAGVRTLVRRRRLRALWDSMEVSPTAMRLSSRGLELSVDSAPDSVFLPWETVRQLLLHPSAGGQLLVVDLFPGVDAATPGVRGLDHPDVRRMLSKRIAGTTGLRSAVRVLDQKPAAIDQAAAYFTADRVRVRG